MGFKMKGSAFKQGGIQGTNGHASALKNRYKKSWRDSESIDRNKDYHNSQHDKGLNHGEDWDMSKENDKWTKKEETEGGPKMKSPLEQNEKFATMTPAFAQDKDWYPKMIEKRDRMDPESGRWARYNQHIHDKLAQWDKSQEGLIRKEKMEGGLQMKSPLEQTSFIDKLKSAATAATSEDGLMAVNFGPAKFVDRYKREKKKKLETARHSYQRLTSGHKTS